MKPDYEFNNGNKNTALGKRLQETIKKKKITQYAFAQECGVAYETLRTYIKGNASYRVDFLMRAAKVLDVSYEYLLCEEDENGQIVKEPLSATMAKETHLSQESCAKLLDMGNHAHKRNNKYVIECIDTLIQNNNILESLTEYFLFVRNRNVCIPYYHNAKNEDEWQYINDNIPHPYPAGFSREDISIILLYQMMKNIDTSVKRELLNKNVDNSRKRRL